ncbi:MAG TPA: hypothetical protein ENO27_01810 [Caldithrix sp.]|nr:hypothetical protein [Caldithrix sp.]
MAIAIIITIDFWLINIPERVRWGSEFGIILSSLSMAYIASFIFYIVTIHIKSVRDSKNIQPYLKKCSIEVLEIHSGIHNSIINSAQPRIHINDVVFSKEYYLELLTKILNSSNRIDPIQSIVFSQIRVNSLEFLISQIKVIQSILKDCIKVSQYHHSELVKISTAILDTEIFRYMTYNEYLITQKIVVLDSNNVEIFAGWLNEFDNEINYLFEYIKKI